MNNNKFERKYDSFKIPNRQQDQKKGNIQAWAKDNVNDHVSSSDEIFHEIEYESNPITGVSQYVMKPKSQKIQDRKSDPIRERFNQMRDITRAHRQRLQFYRFSDRRTPIDDANIFYQQAQFMKDFTDDYEGKAPISFSLPCYQMMGYEQLRTYFTWRTKVRMGVVSNTSLPYVFLYLYELIANIGVADPQDGLDKLMFFWKEFRKYGKDINPYVLRWLKDYHIYYKLPHTFKEFVDTNTLTDLYPQLVGEEDSFELFCSISKYDIAHSSFLTDETRGMITDCFAFVMDKVRRSFEAGGMKFEDVLFRPTRKLEKWKPFHDALFYDDKKYLFRQVVLTKDEIYVCKSGEWMKGSMLTTEKGRQFIGYVMKQMESSLRSILKYRFKLTANTDMIHEDTTRILNKAGIYIEKIVPAAVVEYYRESTKTVVTVDRAALDRIREEALETQESLIVEEYASESFCMSEPTQAHATTPTHMCVAALTSEPAPDLMLASPCTPCQHTDASTAPDLTTLYKPEPITDVWAALWDKLTDVEREALSVIAKNDSIKSFADSCGVMLEVLMDGINEKAMDFIGDNLMDDDFNLYDDYVEQVKEWIK